MVELTTGRQSSLAPSDRDQLLYNAAFKVWTVEGQAFFSELGGIVSEIEQTEYMEAGPGGAFFSRQAGRSKPPTVTLKRALRVGPSLTWLWTWHQAARQSLPSMHRQCELTLFGPGDDLAGPGRMTYVLYNAWPTRMEIGAVKAGGTEVVVQTVTLQCDDLFDSNFM